MENMIDIQSEVLTENYYHYAVDIPPYVTKQENLDDINFVNDFSLYENLEWKNVSYFKTKQDAIEFVKRVYGGDDEGRVCLVSSL